MGYIIYLKMNFEAEENEITVKLVLLGESGVGKTNIFTRYS